MDTLNRLLGLPAETEVLEFKEAKNQNGLKVYLKRDELDIL